MRNVINAPQSWLTRSPKILVIGVGGTGSEVMSRLLKLNTLIERLDGLPLDVTVADGDTVSEFNIGRQNFYMCDIGENKAEVTVNRMNVFCNTQWKYIDQMINPSNIGNNKYDLVITCVDSGIFRAELGERFSDLDSQTLWLDGGNDNNSGQIIMGHLGRCKDKHPNLWDLFGDQLMENAGDDTPSCSSESAIAKQTFGINSQIAEIMIQMLWQLLRTTMLEKTISYVNLKTLDVSSVDACPKQWALYGYTDVA